eukprot:TRINITY_DN7992_c0_g1_i1.p2 TRINITY_DN7992_c0_g1~~TRINITY_DN7992_c0_g1_i1.p2  ORF type:complete len:189 (+),score=34.36 TRINITY_DN7992_c0_g1_i1:696-1262(+)
MSYNLSHIGELMFIPKNDSQENKIPLFNNFDKKYQRLIFEKVEGEEYAYSYSFFMFDFNPFPKEFMKGLVELYKENFVVCGIYKKKNSNLKKMLVIWNESVKLCDIDSIDFGPFRIFKEIDLKSQSDSQLNTNLREEIILITTNLAMILKRFNLKLPKFLYYHILSKMEGEFILIPKEGKHSYILQNN